MSEAKKRFDELDGLKIFFALGVVLYHYYGHLGEGSLANCPRLSAFVYNYGWLGVEFFFILSGFLMEHTYRNIIENMTFGQFLRRRLKSLYAPYLCAECLGLLISFFDYILCDGQFWFYKGYQITVSDIFRAFTMTMRGWNTDYRHPFMCATWFINVLVLCYALYFAVLRLSKRAKIKPIYLYIAAMLFAWGFLQLGAHFPFLLYSSCRGYLCFFVGCILYHVQQSGVFSRKFYVLALDLVVLFFLAVGHKFGIPEIFGDVQLAFVFLVFPVLILSIENLPPLKKLFAAKPLVLASSYSMDIYLTHMFILEFTLIFNYYFGWNLNFASYKTLGILLLCVFAFAFIWHIVVGKWFVPLFNRWFDSFLNVPQNAAPAQSAD